MSDYDIPRLKWSAGGMLKDDKGGYVFYVDYDNVEIALRLAQAQNRELRKQLATATEALEDVVNAGDSTVMYRTAKQALAAIKPNQVEQPCTDGNAPHKRVSRQIKEQSRQQWKPIETHPKNGKEFMCINTAGNIDIQWHPMVPAPEEYTHWMALPAPPMSDK